MPLISGKKIEKYRWTYGLSVENLIENAGLSIDSTKLKRIESAKRKVSLGESDLAKLLAFSNWPVEFFQGVLGKTESDIADYFRSRDYREELKKEGFTDKDLRRWIRPAKLKRATLETPNFDQLYWMFENCYLLERDNRFNIGLVPSHKYYMALLAAQFYDFVRDAPDGKYFTDYHLLIRKKQFKLRKAPGEFKMSEKLKMARKHCRMSFNELSSKLSISHDFLSEIERNPERAIPHKMREKMGTFIRESSISLSNYYYFKLDCFHREMYNDFLNNDKFSFPAKLLLPDFDYIYKLPKEVICKIHLTLEKHFS